MPNPRFDTRGFAPGTGKKVPKQLTSIGGATAGEIEGGTCGEGVLV